MSKISNIQTAKQRKEQEAQGQPKEQPKQEPVDISKLADGAYPLAIVGAGFVKRGNEGLVMLSLQFTNPELSNSRMDVTLAKLNFGGNIIVPGVKVQGPIVPLIKS